MTRSVRPWMVFLFAILAFVFSANAQYQSNWGTGMYPAQPACGYQNSIGDSATSIRDELNSRTRELQQAKQELRSLRSRQSSLEAGVRSQSDLFKLTGFDGAVYNQIENHINSGISCNQYQGSAAYCRGNGGYSFNDPETDGANARMPAADLGGYDPPPDDGSGTIPETEPPAPNPPSNNGGYRPPPQRQCQDGNIPIDGMSPRPFLNNCGPGPGELRPGICDQVIEGSMPRGRSAGACKKYLRGWMDKKRELRGMEVQMAELDAKILELEALTKASKAELAEAMREREEMLRNGQTQGGCLECAMASNGGGGGYYQQPKSSGLWNLAGGIIAAGIQAYSSYNLGKYVANQNAKLGFQTQQIPLSGHILSAGWPMISGGLYGVLGGGGGQGSFGCGGGPFGGGQQFGQMGFGGAAGFGGPYGANGALGMNGMWGFPQQMYGSPAGGGMFNVGMGMGFQPGYGAQAYCPVQPCPLQGQVGLGGFPGMGGQFGGGFGGGFGGFPGAGGGYNPFQPGMGTNLGFSAGIGGGMPYGYGGVGGYNGIPGYGGVGVGYGGVPGQYGGFYGAGGMPYGGMPGMPGYGAQGGVWAGTPQPYGGVGGVYGANPYGAQGMQYNNYQYQQQMMQAQAQQYALVQQQQQAAYQAQLAQQQTLSNLYGEMYSLNARIQSAQSSMGGGGFSGGYLGAPGYSGYGGYGAGAGFNFNMGAGAVTPQPFPYNQPATTTPAFSR